MEADRQLSRGAALLGDPEALGRAPSGSSSVPLLMFHLLLSFNLSENFVPNSSLVFAVL